MKNTDNAKFPHGSASLDLPDVSIEYLKKIGAPKSNDIRLDASELMSKLAPGAFPQIDKTAVSRFRNSFYELPEIKTPEYIPPKFAEEKIISIREEIARRENELPEGKTLKSFVITNGYKISLDTMKPVDNIEIEISGYDTSGQFVTTILHFLQVQLLFQIVDLPETGEAESVM